MGDKLLHVITVLDKVFQIEAQLSYKEAYTEYIALIKCLLSISSDYLHKIIGETKAV